MTQDVQRLTKGGVVSSHAWNRKRIAVDRCTADRCHQQAIYDIKTTVHQHHIALSETLCWARIARYQLDTTFTTPIPGLTLSFMADSTFISVRQRCSRDYEILRD